MKLQVQRTAARIVLIAWMIVGLRFSMALAGDDPVSANREAVVADLRILAARAQQFCYKPLRLGGGSGDFSSITIGDLTCCPVNANGQYVVTSSSSSQLVLDGTGTEEGDDGNSISVTITVFADSTSVVYNN